MNIELFDKAVAVIDRTPDDQLELGYWQDEEDGEELDQ
jgi:hypothetical protein